MNLIEDVKIYFESEELLDRLSVTNGTVKLEGWKERSRYFPAKQWSAITREQFESLWLSDEGAWLTGKHIGIISFPEDTWKPLSNFLFRFEPHFFSDWDFLSEHNNDYIKALYPIVDFLPKVLLSTENLSIIGVNFNQPGLEAVTIHQNRKLMVSGFQNQIPFTGLHVDSYQNILLSERHRLANLLMLNLGNEPRYLLFVNLTIEKIVELVFDEPPDILDEEYIKFEIKKRFFDRFPDYPVIRLRIEPGEAYIGPFENIFHDGSTLDKVQSDAVLAVQGMFAPAPFIL